jgi:hypothetical protein
MKNNVIGQGARFTNMTSTFPLCCPGRATIQRGQYVHNALGPSDTTYPPPNPATIAYYEQRLDDLYDCSGQSCRTAENAPLSP